MNIFDSHPTRYLKVREQEMSPSVGRVMRLLLGGILMAAGAMAWADTRPAAFDFVDVTVSDKQAVYSNVVTVKGIDAPTPMQVRETARDDSDQWRGVAVGIGDRQRQATGFDCG